jgi:hypothetical protein
MTDDKYESLNKLIFGAYDNKYIQQCYNGNYKHQRNVDRRDGVFWMEITSDRHW